MEIDLSQFHAVFFEECTEGLEIMEKGLLDLDIDNSDPDSINNIFRAAHSIKGGAGTFGFAEIGEFTHIVETILDEMRSGKRQTTRELVDLLLKCVDFLRNSVNSCKAGGGMDNENRQQLESQLNALAVSDTGDKGQDIREIMEKGAGWRIKFYPYKNMFYTGNDPLRLLRELQTHGELTVSAVIDQLPDFDDMNPENCYIGWDILVEGSTTFDELNEIFAWVEGDCELDISLQNDRRRKRGRRISDTDESYQESAVGGRRKTDIDQAQLEKATSIRVGVEKVDTLVNLVGELVINQLILSRECNALSGQLPEKLRESLDTLERHTRSLQEQSMGIRMLPIDFAFQRLPRLVRDLSAGLGKKVKLNFQGRETELDKNVLEKISDPLIHLIRNSLDHGLELPDERLAAGKPETGTINVSASHEGGNIVIRVIDDGAGLDTEKIFRKAVDRGMINPDEELTDLQIKNLIFLPGFSTATIVNDVSGRGVGMDVVKSNIHQLGGTVDVQSRTGDGCTFTIRLPLTLAILDGQLLRAGDQTYIVSLLSIVESVQVKREYLNAIAGKADVYRYRDQYIPVIRLKEIFNIPAGEDDRYQGIIVIVDIGIHRIGLHVDEVLGQQQVVIKSLEQNYQNVEGIAGASILGDGSVALILDAAGLVRHYLQLDGEHGNKAFSEA